MTEILELPVAMASPMAASVSDARLALVEAVNNHENHFVSVDGPCPLTDNPEITMEEARQKVGAAADLSGYIALDRECFFKPRTDPTDWHGLDSSDPERAHQIVSDLAATHANVIAEVGSMKQFHRYGNSLTALWIGGRYVDRTDLIADLAVAAPDIVVGIKNGLDGGIDLALEQVELVSRLRGGEGAPAILIYRGGENARTPQTSQDMYKRAHEATDGKLFYDAAHGVEMAYHPDGGFKKSATGQALASQALIHLAEQGYAPFGKFAEASAIEPIMDPHMSLEQALQDSRRVHAVKLG